MSLIRLYVRHERLILPTVAETEAGFYVDMEPINVFEIHELEKWRQELYLRLANGNPLVPTPERSEDPGSAILERLNITKWSTFETSAIMYTIHSGGRYISVYRTGKGADGMWTQENTDLRQFASRTPLSWIARAVAEDVVKQPEANRPKTSLMLAPPAKPESEK
ncbi:MAG: hypothetical protein JST89_26050 [Cyanobacteria bacterium SZAS-4]|nr:hypothetical protein [Cyanobacteria bacterium SZAS-4]